VCTAEVSENAAARRRVASQYSASDGATRQRFQHTKAKVVFLGELATLAQKHIGVSKAAQPFQFSTDTGARQVEEMNSRAEVRNRSKVLGVESTVILDEVAINIVILQYSGDPAKVLVQNVPFDGS
jgi:hypothetical protein